MTTTTAQSATQQHPVFHPGVLLAFSRAQRAEDRAERLADLITARAMRDHPEDSPEFQQELHRAVAVERRGLARGQDIMDRADMALGGAVGAP